MGLLRSSNLKRRLIIMDQVPQSSNQSDSNKWLVRILLIIGIGIPVLIELFTFSGLVSSHFFGEAPSATNDRRSETSAKENIPLVKQGDTLFSDTDYPLLVDTLRLEIYPDQWRFIMELKPLWKPNRERSEGVKLTFQNLVTQQQSLEENRVLVWTDNTLDEAEITWILPTGQRPQNAKVTYRSTRQDSLTGTLDIKRHFEFGHVPARYKQ